MTDTEIRDYFKRRLGGWARIAYMGWAMKARHLDSNPEHSAFGRGWTAGYKEGHDEAVEWMLNQRASETARAS